MSEPEITEDSFRADGALLDSYRALSLIQNSSTGLGTSRDKSQSAEINLSPRILSLHERIGLVRGSRIARRAVFVYPTEAAAGWAKWTIGSSKRIKSEDIDLYLENLRTGSLKSALTEAAIEARWHGDGFVLLGIDDGKEWDEPVDESSIKSVRWAEPLAFTEISPDPSSGREPQLYFVNKLDANAIARDGEERSVIQTPVHRSRLLHLKGDRLTGTALRYNGGRNDSVLQVMFDSFAAFTQGLQASSAMLADYSVFKYKLKNLAKKIERDTDGSGVRDLMARFLAIQMGMSVIKGLAMDADTEDAEFVNRSYAGIESILKSLEDHLVANSDLPRMKLLGSAARSSSGNLGNEGRGEQDRYEWATLLHAWQENNYGDPLRYMQRLVLLSRDGPSGGRVPDGYGLEFPSTLQLTRKEEAELRLTSAQTRDLDIKNQVIAPIEARLSAYGSAQWSAEVTLDPQITEQMRANALPSPDNQQVNPARSGNNDDASERMDADGYQPPASAKNAAKRVLKWREEHPDEIKGMTSVGWTRARQLAEGKPLSLSTVKRIAAFNRHRSNYDAARKKAEFKSEPWKSAAIVAWLGWGGTSCMEWAKRVSASNQDEFDEDFVIDEAMEVNGEIIDDNEWEDLSGISAADWIKTAKGITQ